MKKGFTTTEIGAFKNRLDRLYAGVEEEIETLLGEKATGHGDNWSEIQGDRALEATEQDIALGRLELDAQTREAIVDALHRVESGTFGRCLRCQSWISPDRLNAIPYASHCLDCQKRFEAKK